jgi:two-component system, LytTR family, response regulator
MKKVLLIDDEKDARILLRQYLQAYPGYEIIDECVNGLDAVGKINSEKPDLIFLDIQMPGISGFQVVQQLVHVPQVIFTTAYDKYALRAFDNNAIDYLLKPYTAERFDKAMSKLASQDNQSLSRIQYTSHEPNTNNYPVRMLVESGNKLANIDVLDIYYLEAERDYTKIVTAEKTYLSNYGIGSLQLRLNPQLFLRVHRSYIVNIHHIQEVYKDGYSIQLVMKNSVSLNVSRSYVEEFKRLIF